MPILISLLRGINVGGRNKIRMAELRALYEALGYRGARTLLQSGNVVFHVDECDLARVRPRLENALAEQFGFHVPVVLRSAADLRRILSRHPFDEGELAKPAKAAIAFLDAKPDETDVARLRDANPGRESIHAHGCQLYLYYVDGMARSRLDLKRIEKMLSITGTIRNWNTSCKLRSLADELEAQSS